MKNYKDYTPKISLPVLGTLCFVTLLMCQISFKVTKELSYELSPPITRNKNCWFLYSDGNSDRFQCVLRAYVLISSPVVSFVSTVLLIHGKIQSNPYYFIPWLFLTIKGLLLVQTNNLITIFKDMTASSNHTFGCRTEDVKWLVFYFTFFLIDLVEAFSFCEIFDLFLLLWNRHPGYNEEYANLEGVKKEITDIIENLSKCSSGRSSKLSSPSMTDSEEGKEILNNKKSIKFSDRKTLIERRLLNPDGYNLIKGKDEKGKIKNFSATNVSVSQNTNTKVTGSKDVNVDSLKSLDGSISEHSLTKH